MNSIRNLCAALFSAAAVVTTLSAAADAAGSYDINVVLPLTGSAAFVGQGEKDSLLALQDQINATGGIADGKLNFIFHDDQTQPQLAVQLTTQIVGAQPAVVMGSSLVAMCLAMAPLMENGPVQYCLSPGIHPKGGSYVFSTSSSSTDQIAAVVRYYRMKGWTRMATARSPKCCSIPRTRARWTSLSRSTSTRPTCRSPRRWRASKVRVHRRSLPGPPVRRRRRFFAAWRSRESICRWRRPAAIRPLPR